MGSYELEESLANGPGSTIWRAVSNSGGSHGQKVVLTIVPSITASGEPASLDNLVGIADLWHPNLTKIFNVGGAKAQICVVEEHVDGSSLHTLAQTMETDGQGVPRRRILRALGITCKALAYLHERGLYHGGLDSKRVMVTERGWVKVRGAGLIKIGAAHRIASGLLQSGGAGVGTGMIEHCQAGDRWAVAKMIDELALAEDPRAARALRELRRQTRPPLSEVGEAFLSAELGTPALEWWQAPSDTP